MMNKIREKIVIVTNSPAPYRENLYKSLSKKYDLKVFFLNKQEKNRSWKFNKHKYPAYYLSSKFIYFGEYPIYFSLNIYSEIIKFKPKQIFICGMGLSFLFLLFISKLNKIKTTLFIDGNLISESSSKLGLLIKINKIIFLKYFNNAVVVGNKGVKLLTYYNFNIDKIYLSPLTINNKIFSNHSKKINFRTIDILLIGRFIPKKNFSFCIDIFKELESKLNQKLVIALIGDGPEKETIRNKLNNLNLKILDYGFVQPKQLPKLYGISKIMLFPSLADAWGMTVNESMASGVCVLSSKYIGAAGDLIINEHNGYVLDLDIKIWVNKIVELLSN